MPRGPTAKSAVSTARGNAVARCGSARVFQKNPRSTEPAPPALRRYSGRVWVLENLTATTLQYPAQWTVLKTV